MPGNGSILVLKGCRKFGPCLGVLDGEKNEQQRFSEAQQFLRHEADWLARIVHNTPPITLRPSTPRTSTQELQALIGSGLRWRPGKRSQRSSTHPPTHLPPSHHHSHTPQHSSQSNRNHEQQQQLPPPPRRGHRPATPRPERHPRSHGFVPSAARKQQQQPTRLHPCSLHNCPSRGPNPYVRHPTTTRLHPPLPAAAAGTTAAAAKCCD